MKLKISAVLLFTTIPVFAHNGDHNGQTQQDYLTIKSSLGVQLGGHDSEQMYQFPGVMLGQEATVRDEGVAIEDLQLLALKKLKSETYVKGKLGYHQHSGAGELELEGLSLGKHFRFGTQNLTLELGKMSSEITPSANYHPSQDAFADTPLLSNVFFGGHHKDSGIRGRWSYLDWSLLLEGFNGENWPYSNGEYHVQAGIQYTFKSVQHSLHVGVWSAEGSAKNRIDERYQQAHNHGQNVFDNDLISYQFNGDITQQGAFALWQYKFDPNWQVRSEFEYIQQIQDGSLYDDNQTGFIEQTMDGYRLQLGLSYENHQLEISHETLVIDNQFADTSTLFAEQLGLINQSFEPTQIKIAYLWQWQPQLRIRLQWQNDQTVIENDSAINSSPTGQKIVHLSFIWHHDLL